MRSAILVLLVASACSGQLIQSNGNVSSGTATTCAFPYNVVSGNILVVASEWFNSSSTPSVSDTLGSSFTQMEISTASLGSNAAATAYVAAANGSGADTITISISGSSFQNTQCAELSSAFVTTTRGQHGNTTAAATLNLTTTKNGEPIFGVVGGFASASSYAPSPADINMITGTNGADSGTLAYKVPGAAGTYAMGFTNHGSPSSTVLAFSLLPPSGITITSPSTIPDGISGTAYSWQLGAVGGAGAYTWSITSGSLQTGLSISSGGIISGTPSATGSRTVTVSVTDGTSTQTKSITIGVGTSFSTITIVQSTANASTHSKAFTSNVTAGNLIIVDCALSSGNTVAANKPSDTISTPFTFIGSLAFNGGTNWDHKYFYYGIAPSSAADTVTCVNPGANGVFLPHIAEISGLFAATDIASVTTGTGLTSGTATSSTLTPQVANEIIYAVGSGYTTVPTAVTAPFTQVATTISTDFVSSNIVSSTSGITNSYTLSGNTAGTWGIMATSFPASATSIPANTSSTQVGGFLVGP